MTKDKTKKKVSTRKNVAKVKTTNGETADKQYTINYTIGSDPRVFVAHGTDYKLSTLDVQSIHTSEIVAFPVVFVIDDVVDTLDIIPMNSVGKIRYNWGFGEESKKFMSEFEALKKEMLAKKNAEESGSSVHEEKTLNLSKKKPAEHDRNYG